MLVEFTKDTQVIHFGRIYPFIEGPVEVTDDLGEFIIDKYSDSIKGQKPKQEDKKPEQQ